MARSVVLGIGNVLLTDDGAGVHAARRLAERLAAQPFSTQSDIRVLDGGTLSFTLAPLIADTERLIILDAMELGEPAGTVQCFLGAAVDRLLGRAGLTVHEVGLRDVLAIARLADALPRERALIGVQPACIDWGPEPSERVAAALDRLVDMTLDLLGTWPTERVPAGGQTVAVARGLALERPA